MKLSQVAIEAGKLHLDLKERIIPYWKILIQSDLCPRPIRNKSEPDHVYVDFDGTVTLFIEYNDSCHCHPEYVTHEFVLQTHELDMSLSDFRAMIHVRDEQQKFITKHNKLEAEKTKRETSKKNTR